MPITHPRRPVSQPGSLLDTRDLSLDEIIDLFRRADEFSDRAQKGSSFVTEGELGLGSKSIAGLFLEASTRTRMSFQIAAQRLKSRTVVLDGDSSSSMSKGETDVDTVLNIAAMQPDAIIIRYSQSPGLDELLPRLKMPVISAGSGTDAHPTQALLDAYTILRERGRKDFTLSGERILIVGDIAHSRVARSGFDVFTRLGADVAICGPSQWLPSSAEPGIKTFADLDEALSWPTVYMGLRVQLERHAQPGGDSHSRLAGDFHSQFGLSEKRLAILSAGALIMHPGPINHGVEFCPAVVKDSRARILSQVSNGVLIRAAVLERALAGGGDK